MTREELLSLKDGDKVYCKTFDIDCEVVECIDFGCSESWAEIKYEKMHLLITEDNLDQFVIIKEKTYIVPIDVECCLNWHITARSQEEALEIAMHMIKTVSDEYILNGCRLSNATILEGDIEEEKNND